MFRGHGETHRGVDGGVGGGRHRGVQGAPDGHWGHLIHTPACGHMLDNTWTRNYSQLYDALCSQCWLTQNILIYMSCYVALYLY